MKTKEKSVITFGEVMMRLSPPDHLRFRQTTNYDAIFGGGECNVSITLANFDFPTGFVSRFPDHEIGWSAIDYIRKFGVDTEHILLGGDRIGVYFLEHGAVARPSKIIYDRYHSAFSQIKAEMIDWDYVFADAQWFHWTGITPAVSEGAMETCLAALKAAKSKGLFISGDPNFRSGLWKYGKEPEQVLREFVSYCDLIVANEWDSNLLLGESIEAAHQEFGKDSFRLFFDKMKKSYSQLKYITTTRRESISASHNKLTGLLIDAENMLVSNTYDITHIVDRVGGGDTYIGSLIYGMLTYRDSRARALEFATAASALKHTIFGDATYLSVEEVERLVDGDGSGKVLR